MFGSPLGPLREERRWACSTARLKIGPRRVVMGSPQMERAITYTAGVWRIVLLRRPGRKRHPEFRSRPTLRDRTGAPGLNPDGPGHWTAPYTRGVPRPSSLDPCRPLDLGRPPRPPHW